MEVRPPSPTCGTRSSTWAQAVLIASTAWWGCWGGPVVHIPKRPGEPDRTFADTTKIRARLHWKPEVSFEDGVARLLACIEDWRGAPVVSSNATSLPDVVGDAALLVDPFDVEGLAGAMTRVVEHAELREGLRKRGALRVKAFSWEQSARYLLRAYQGLAQEKTA